MNNHIATLTLEEKVELLKELIDSLDILVTASYGATGYISSEDINIANKDNNDYSIKANQTVIISTNIMTG
jgi:hypothetical protein